MLSGVNKRALNLAVIYVVLSLGAWFGALYLSWNQPWFWTVVLVGCSTGWAQMADSYINQVVRGNR